MQYSRTKEKDFDVIQFSFACDDVVHALCTICTNIVSHYCYKKINIYRIHA